MKLKIRPDAEHRYNSPWNIATDFTIDMSFSVEEIAGYPYLVSCICKVIDEKLSETEVIAGHRAAWSKESPDHFAIRIGAMFGFVTFSRAYSRYSLLSMADM